MAGGAGGGVWVFYYIQGEDGDSAETPNAFNVKSAANEVRLGQFLQVFPLRGHGEYHFRFRAPDQISGYCWIDVSDPSAVLPRYDNTVCAKALRLDRLPKPRSSRLRRKAPYGSSGASSVGAGKRGLGIGDGGGGDPRGSTRPAEPPRRHHPTTKWHGHSPQDRPRSASPATHHHDLHGDILHNACQGKSATPPPSRVSRKTVQGSNGGLAGGGGAGGRPPPPPPPTADSENLEDFLFSDSPIQSPTSGAAPPRNPGDFQGLGRRGGGGGGGSSSGNSSSGSLNAVGGRDTPTQPAAATTAGAATSAVRGNLGQGGGGGDLLNFGGAAAAGTTATASAGAGTSAGKTGSPRSWNVRRPPQSAGAGAGGRGLSGASAAADRGPAGGGRTSVGGAGASGGGFASNGSPGSGGGGGSGSRVNGRTQNVPGGPGPDLMDVNGAGGRDSKSSYVQSQVEAREKDLQEKTKAAKKQLKDLEAAAAKDQTDLDAAKQKHDAKLTAWAEDHGKKRNVRTLLSTMHTVLWEGNKWKTVTVGDLLQPSKVKMTYRKAMLLVHPDKCGSLGPEGRLIAKRVFEAVNEAYTIFSEKEMG